MSLKVDIEKQLSHFLLKVSFEMDASGILGLLGPSGCGKSMTLKCIAGIEKPDRGRIELDGVTLFDSEKKINLPPQKRGVGYLFQNYALFPNMTVRRNILCGLHYEKDKAKKERACQEMMELLQIRELADLKPDKLSGGQAQRVALARILVNQPKLLMLDEPFAALDGHLQIRLQMELKELLAGLGCKVLFVSHNRTEAYHMCDSIAVIDRGALITCKPTKLLFANPGSVSAALLTGCKNVVPAKKSGDFEVLIPAWGNLRLQTKEPVGDGLTAIGIRAHYFNPKTPGNRFPVTFTRELEEPFETILLFRFPNQAPETPDIWWRLSKEKRRGELPAELGVSPANVLLLYS